MVPSGGAIDTVSGASLAKLAAPKALGAAICNVMAWIDTLTAGSAMRSVSEKSATVLTAGLRVLRRKGCELMAEMPRTSCGVPLVRDHSTSRPGVPPAAMSTDPDSRASLTAAGPLKVTQDTVTCGGPGARAC